MKIKQLVSILLTGLCMASISYAEEKTQGVNTSNIVVQTLNENNNNEQIIKTYLSAKNYYYTAMQATNLTDRNENLTKAIKDISEIVVANGVEPNVYLLASEIYRAKGGVPYAKRYYKMALAKYKERLNDAVIPDLYNLEYAIACYAGDARLYDDYATYKAQAYASASKAIEYIEYFDKIFADSKLVNDMETMSFLDICKFYAYIVKEDEKSMNALYDSLQKSDAVKNNAYLEKLLANYSSAKNGNWKWQNNNKNAAIRTMLLDFLL